MVEISGVFAGFTGAGAGALVAIQWVAYLLPLLGGLFYFMYWYKHKYTVNILDLTQSLTGGGIGVREYKDKGGIFYKSGIPYFHLLKRHKIKYLRVPLAHEIESDGKVNILRLSEKSYRYAPKKVMIIKNGLKVLKTYEELYQDLFEGDRYSQSQSLMMMNPSFDKKRPVGNPHNVPFLKFDEDPIVREFGEGEIRHYIDESHTDAFSENVKSITESVYNSKDWRPAVVWLGGFATLAIMFIFLVLYSGKI